MSHTSILLRLLGPVVLCAACAGSTTPEEAGVATVAITPASLTLSRLGESRQLLAVARDANGSTVSGKTFVWSSSDTTVVRVGADGTVTAVANGAATISALTDGRSGTCAATVSQAAAFLTVAPRSGAIVGAGGTLDLSATVRDSGGSLIVAPGVEWTALNAGVATVVAQGSNTGRVTARRDGQMAIAVRVGDLRAYCLVTVLLSSSGNPTTWQRVTGVTGQSLYGIWGAAWNDVWAVGAAGTILHYDGTSWTLKAQGLTTRTLFGVWGSASNDVWAVGQASSIFRYDGTSWRDVSPGFTPDGTFRATWGSAPNDVWAVGEMVGAAHYDGRAWTERGGSAFLYGMYGLAPDDIWAVGAGGMTLHYDGTAWSSAVHPSSSAYLYAVWGSGSHDFWASGDAMSFFRYEGSAWVETSGTTFIYGMWGSSANDVWAVGSTGYVLRYDGTAWTYVLTNLSGLGNQRLMAAWGTASSDVWIVGQGGTILRGSR
jgi:hypothetical protein